MTSLNHPPPLAASHPPLPLNLHTQSCDHLHDGKGTIHFRLKSLPLLLDEAAQLRPASVGNDGEVRVRERKKRESNRGVGWMMCSSLVVMGFYRCWLEKGQGKGATKWGIKRRVCCIAQRESALHMTSQSIPLTLPVQSHYGPHQHQIPH